MLLTSYLVSDLAIAFCTLILLFYMKMLYEATGYESSLPGFVDRYNPFSKHIDWLIMLLILITVFSTGFYYFLGRLVSTVFDCGVIIALVLHYSRVIVNAPSREGPKKLEECNTLIQELHIEIMELENSNESLRNEVAELRASYASALNEIDDLGMQIDDLKEIN